MSGERTETAGAVACNLCGNPVLARDRLWRKDGHDIVRCSRCGLTFRGDPPAREALTGLYGPEYFSAAAGELGGQGYLDYLGDEAEHRSNARKRLRLLAQYAAPGHLLDVGCAAGFFLDEAGRKGWIGCGVDVSPSMAAHARERLAIPVQEGQFLDADFGEARFHVVTMWDYIEHVLDPKAEFRLAAELLRPGGLLALSTGDVDSAFARISGRRWHLLTPRHHNFFFARRHLFRYLEEQNLEVLAARYLWSGYSAVYLIHKAQTLGRTLRLRRLVPALERRGLGHLQIPVNLFDIVTIVARKRS
jgi:2-polyprenyl-3-methyl-5-hydroxy-6-metoxy-1,4-benzoquinol methylase/predicted RNA-binding Zn-ribbon protein involved in translation (DUF1610 family)